MAGSSWSNQVVIAALVEIIEGQPGTGLFVYNGTLGFGNPPVLSITNAAVDGQGNVVTPGLVLAGLPELVYTGPPAAGNLLLSVSGVAGTDAFGNPYFTGLQVHGTGAFAASNIELTNQSGIPIAFFSTGLSFESTSGTITGLASGSGGAEILTLDLAGPNVAGFGDRAIVELNSSGESGASVAFGFLAYEDRTGVLHQWLGWSSAGVTVNTAIPGDTSSYQTERLTLSLASDLVINTTPFSQEVFPTINALGVGTYQIDGFLRLSATAAAGTPEFEFTTGTAVATMSISFWEIKDGAPATFGNQGAIAAFGSSFVGAAMNGAGRNVFFRGLMIVSTAGSLGLFAATSVAADTFTISHNGSFMNVYPVGE